MTQTGFIKQRMGESIAVKQQLLENEQLLQTIANLANSIVHCISNGGKLVLCGNGGSASDALHFAGEIVGRFVKERKAWPAGTYVADVSIIISGV